jgi:type I restriction enzyme S subunit
MEVKPGYKQTEVGVIPEEWEVRQLGKIANLERGKFTARPRNQPRFFGGDIPFIQTGDVANSTGEITSYAQTLNDEGLRVSKLFPPETMFFTIAANIGDVGIAPFATAATDSLIAVAPNRGIEKRWLFHALKRRKKIFEGLATHNAQLNINLEKLCPYLLDVPPLPEQRAIAEALSDVDGLLGGLDRLIAKKRDLKQAAMQQLLTGQTRLPGFHGEWEVKELGRLGKISGAGVDKKIRPGEPPVRLVNYMDVYRRNFIYSKDLDHVVSASVEQAARCAVRKGDVFFTPSSEMPFDIAVSAVAMEDIPDACYSYHVVRLRLDEDWDLNFRAYAFKTQAFLDQAARTCEGSGVRYVITQGKFRQLSVRYPTDKAEQTAIAEVLTEMDLELAGLEQRREKTRALKQAMMQELLTGKTRIVSPAQAHA